LKEAIQKAKEKYKKNIRKNDLKDVT